MLAPISLPERCPAQGSINGGDSAADALSDYPADVGVVRRGVGMDGDYGREEESCFTGRSCGGEVWLYTLFSGIRFPWLRPGGEKTNLRP